MAQGLGLIRTYTYGWHRFRVQGFRGLGFRIKFRGSGFRGLGFRDDVVLSFGLARSSTTAKQTTLQIEITQKREP